ncbi:MAG: hypothetical protein ACLQJR_20865 [Stellaceae bacterium]
MKRNSYLSGNVAASSDRDPVRRAPILRYVVLIVAAGVSAGCADDVVMKNPHTGMTETCQESLHGLNPWSQTMACVASHEAQGWTRVDQE